MPVTKFSKATGLASAAGTWADADATAENDSEAVSVNIGVTNLDSNTFVLPATPFARFAVKMARRVGTTGTVTLILRNSTTSTNIWSVTVNASDFPASQNVDAPLGWIVLNPGSTHTPNGTDSYVIRTISSVTGQIKLFASSGNNWSRQVIQNANSAAAPTTNDKLIVAGEMTGAGTNNVFVVTWNVTASTTFGASASGNAIEIGNLGTLRQQLTASTAYLMNILGRFLVGAGGTWDFNASSMPSTSSLIVTFQNVANVDCGLVIADSGTVTLTGASKTVITRMTVDKAAAATVITVVDTTGAQNGDVYVFAPTNRTASEAESKTTSTIDSSTQFTLTAGLTNAHSGTNDANGDIRAEIGNLTRNVKIQGNTSTLGSFVVVNALAVVTLRYVEFTKLGSATANKRGFDINTTTGTFDCQYCSVHDCTVTQSVAFNIGTISGSGITISNNVVYNVANSHVINVATSGVQTITSNMFCRCTDASTSIMNLGDVGGIYNGNFCSGAVTRGITLSELLATQNQLNSNICHTNGTDGILLSNCTSILSCDGNLLYRNGGSGLLVSTVICGVEGVVNNNTFFGNSTAGVTLTSSYGVLFTNCTFNAGVTFTQPAGVNITYTITYARFETCTFGLTSPHTTLGDFAISGNGSAVQINCYNCKIASTVQVSSQSLLAARSFIASSKDNQTTGNFKYWTRNGTITYDSTISGSASPSVRLTPNTASAKLESGPIVVKADNGTTVTVSVKIRKSGSIDGAIYNGAQPRLVLKKNVAAGISADTVLATASAAGGGSFETLSGTTPTVTDDSALTCVVDCDGTVGWVSVDDASSP